MYALLAVKPTLIKVHRWIGLIMGTLILVQGLTGSMVAFRHDFNRLLMPGAFVVKPAGSHAPLDAIISSAAAQKPDARVTRVDLPVTPDDAYLIRLETAKKAITFVSVDPADARVLHTGGLWAWPVEFAYQVHYTLVSGETGERIVGLTGLMILFMAITGPLYWWPGLSRVKSGLQVNLSSGWWRGIRDLHRVGGLLVCLCLLVIAGTGVIMAWEPWTKPVIAAIVRTEHKPAPKAPPGECTLGRIDDAVAVARALKPQQTIKSVRFPGKDGRVAALYFRAASGNPRATDHVWIDRCSGRIMGMKSDATASPGEAVFSGLLPIHTGEFLGLPGRLLALLSALALLALGVTGYIQWYTRMSKARKNRASRRV